MLIRYEGGRYGTLKCAVNGFEFIKGQVVDLGKMEIPAGKNRDHADMLKVVTNHPHFTKVTPAMLKKEAEKLAKVAEEAARAAQEEALKAASSAADIAPHEESEAEREDEDGPDEDAAEEASADRPRRTGGRRRG